MCFGSPKAPEAPPLPEQQKPAELEGGKGIKRADERRSQLLIKRKTGAAGVAPTTKNIA